MQIWLYAGTSVQKIIFSYELLKKSTIWCQNMGKVSRLLDPQVLRGQETVLSADNQQETNHKSEIYVVGSSTTTRQTS